MLTSAPGPPAAVVAEGVVGVRGARREHEREHADEEAGDVGEHVRRVGDDRERRRQQPADDLGEHERRAHRDAHEQLPVAEAVRPLGRAAGGGGGAGGGSEEDMIESMMGMMGAAMGGGGGGDSDEAAMLAAMMGGLGGDDSDDDKKEKLKLFRVMMSLMVFTSRIEHGTRLCFFYPS